MNFVNASRYWQGWRMKMSNERYQLHWITAIISVLKTLKEMMIPIIVLVFVNGVNDTGVWFIDYFTFIMFGIALLLFFISGIVKWKRYVYWFEDDELRIEYGLFVKKKRYIPFDRIQSLDYTESILHRPFKLVKVSVETAGESATLSAEAELTAITKEAATVIEQELAAAKKRKQLEANGEYFEGIEQSEDESVIPTRQATTIFQMPMKDLLILATTSGGVGLILSGAIAFLSQFIDVLPLKEIYDEMAIFVKSGILFIAILVVIGLFIVWGISVFMTLLAYYSFTVQLEDEDLIITRGLLEKKRATVPLKRVQSIRIVENPFRQLFGYAAVIIDNPGGGISGDGARIKLMPLVKKARIMEPLQRLFPDVHFEVPTTKLRGRSKRFYYRLHYVWTLPVIASVSYFYFPYGLLSILLIPLVMLLGIWRHHSAAYDLTENQLTMRSRVFSLETTYVKKNRIQSMQMKQNYFHRKNKVATIAAAIKSGMVPIFAEVKHMEESEAVQIMKWYEPKKRRAHKEEEKSEGN